MPYEKSEAFLFIKLAQNGLKQGFPKMGLKFMLG